MTLVQMIHDATDHIKVYLVAGTLVALGVDVAGNATGGMGGMVGGAVAGMGNAMAMLDAPDLPPALGLGVQGIGALIAVVGAAMYLGNMWCGYVALRRFRFAFRERGPLLMACGWSAAFLYVLASAVVGLAVQAVYLAIVG
jgi:hypothetical protein